MSSALNISGIRKCFGKGDNTVEVLKRIDIDVAPGEFLILVGPSGCGKSTLLNIIAGLEEPTEGSISIGDRNVVGVPPAQRDIAMVFQSYALYPTMSVAENIGFALEIRKVPKAERQARIAEVAAMLQIEHLLDRRSSRAVSVSVWPWAVLWRVTRSCFCLTSLCLTSMQSYALRCVPRSSACTRSVASPACM
jgi:multiple sugar transport system ATP-binding protein